MLTTLHTTIGTTEWSTSLQCYFSIPIVPAVQAKSIFIQDHFTDSEPQDLIFSEPRSCTQVKNVVWNSLRVGIDFRQLSSLHFLLLRLSQTIENNVLQCAKCKIPFGIGKQKKIIQSNKIYRILLLLCAMWNNSRGCFTQWQWHVAPYWWLFLVN